MLDSHGRLHRADLPPRSASAQAGIQALQRGVQVNKHGRQGKPHATVLSLSQDERTLSWAASRTVQRVSSFGRAAKKIAGGADKSRSIDLADAVELLVGRASSVFQRASKADGLHEHLCLSLILSAALPAPPSASDGADGDADDGAAERETLDLAFRDEEDFGSCLAALRGTRFRITRTLLAQR